MNTFSERHGYSAPEPDITIREDAPDVLRGAISTAAAHAGMGFNELRQVVCQSLAIAPDTRGNWSESNVMDEVRCVLEECEWFEVYDAIEAIARALAHQPHTRYDQQPPADVFSHDINRVLRRNGIGWQLIGDRIEMRGSEVFETAVREGRDELWKAGKQTTATELHEALRDLSRRPDPELTGAIQHGIAALECLCPIKGELRSNPVAVERLPLDRSLGRARAQPGPCDTQLTAKASAGLRGALPHPSADWRRSWWRPRPHDPCMDPASCISW